MKEQEKKNQPGGLTEEAMAAIYKGRKQEII